MQNDISVYENPYITRINFSSMRPLRISILKVDDACTYFNSFTGEGLDYEATPLSIIIPAGSVNGSLACSDAIVTVIDDDIVEMSESFGIELMSSDPVLYIGDPNSALVVIMDDNSK